MVHLYSKINGRQLPENFHDNNSIALSVCDRCIFGHACEITADTYLPLFPFLRGRRENLERKEDSVENRGVTDSRGLRVAVIFRRENFINKKVSQRREHGVDEWSGNKKFGELAGVLFLWVAIVFQKIMLPSLSGRHFHPRACRTACGEIYFLF